MKLKKNQKQKKLLAEKSRKRILAHSSTQKQATQRTFTIELQKLIDSYRNNPNYTLIPLVENPTLFTDFIIKNNETNSFFVISLPTHASIANSPDFIQNIKNRFEQFNPSLIPSRIIIQQLTPVSNDSHWVLQQHNIEIDSINFKIEVKKDKTIDSLSNEGNLDGSHQTDNWSCGHHVLNNIEHAILFSDTQQHLSEQSQQEHKKREDKQTMDERKIEDNVIKKVIELSKQQTNLTSSLSSECFLDKATQEEKTLIYNVEKKINGKK